MSLDYTAVPPHVVERVRARLVPGGADGTCLLWPAHVEYHGYARTRYKGQRYYVHVLMWVAAHGPKPEGVVLDHGTHCGDKRCANPDHMVLADYHTSVYRSQAVGALNAGKLFCVRGHPFDEANTHRYGSRRVCRACNRVRYAERKARKRSLDNQVLDLLQYVLSQSH